MANALNIPQFVRAKTALLLQQEMLNNNLKTSKEYMYQDISYSKGFWYAWFYEKVVV